MGNLSIDISKVYGYISMEEIFSMQEKVYKANMALHEKSGKGNDFLGWLNLPSAFPEKLMNNIKKTAGKIQNDVELVVVVGIGGSYLGARAVSEALSDSFAVFKSHNKPLLLFAGQNICEDYLSELLEVLNKKKYAIIVISKSGTTTEPAIAFRILKKHLEEKEGVKQAGDLIMAVTDEKKGALRSLSLKKGYQTFAIPDDVGGRYSVLTPVGLVPLAAGGFDIEALIEGAHDMEKLCSPNTKFKNNPAALYAAARYCLYQRGKKIEILANFDSRLHFFGEWWKQLYGESEGKEGLGIFPGSVDFTADLHSMGQYIQQGERSIFETVISVAKPKTTLKLFSDPDDLDQLNYLSGKGIDTINKMAELGTMLAHVDGGVPNIRIEIPEISAYYLGQLIYFFEKACGISGYLLNINPFDQPGVEDYKKNMFALLEKPGFEEETKKIRKRL